MPHKRDKSNPFVRSPRKSEACPCDSGRLFEACCAKKKLKWLLAKDGTWVKEVPLHPEAKRIFNEEKKEFKELFGRAMGESDFIMFRGIALMPGEEYERQMSDALEKAEVRPDIAFAILKTGLILTQETESLATGKDIDDWEAAIEEYWELEANGGLESQDHRDFLAVATPILEEYERVLVVLGCVTSMGGPTRQKGGNALMHSMFCTVRALRTLRALKLLTDQRFGEDGLALVRSAYESYLNIAFILSNEEHADSLFWARLGLRAGTHQYAVRGDGRPDWTKIVDKKTGKIHPNNFRYRDMAKRSLRKEDLALYDDFYPFLSTFAHPDASTLENYSDAKRFDHANSSMYVEARALGLFVGFFIVDALCESGFLSRRFESDLRRYRKRTASILLSILGPQFPGAFVASFTARVKRCIAKT